MKIKFDHQNIYFTADPHFGHANIIKFCKRPFLDVGVMNDVLESNINQFVSKDNVLFIIGDFFFDLSFVRLEELLKTLSGFKHVYFLKGNHDHSKHRRLVGRFWPKSELVKVNANYTFIEDSIVEIIIPDEELEQDARLILCHYPIARWNASYHGSWHLFGHTHGAYIHPEFNAVDVGVDNWDFEPISYNKVKEIITLQNINKIYEYGIKQ